MILHKKMAGRIKLFQQLKHSYFEAMGIYLPHSTQKCSPNWRNALIAFFIAQLFVAAFVYLAYGADSTFEYGTDFYASVSESCCLSYFVIQYFQMPKITALIDSCEEFIEKSEFRSYVSLFVFFRLTKSLFILGIHSQIIYNEMNEKIERISKLVYTIFVEASIVGLVLPPLLITLVNYFIYDLKDESYFLPTPVKYVVQYRND